MKLKHGSVSVAGMVLLGHILTAGASQQETMAADSAWSDLTRYDLNSGSSQDYSREASQRIGSDPQKLAEWREQTKCHFRQAGLVFWRTYPQDARRYEWLASTVAEPPKGMCGKQGVAGQPDPQLAWQVAYISMRAEYLNAPQLDPAQRWTLHQNELMSDIMKVIENDSNRTADIGRILELTRRGFDLAVSAPLSGSAGDSGLYPLSMLYDSGFYFQVPGLERHFVGMLNASTNPELRMQGQRLAKRIAVTEKPIELELTDVGGERVRLEDLRGKVVLLDFWSYGCSSCVESMPHLSDVQARYRDKGFRVISVYLSGTTIEHLGPEEEHKRMQRTLEKAGVNYRNVFADDKQAIQLRERFGITSVPVMFLFDQKGKLVSSDAGRIMRGEWLGTTVGELLTATR